MAAGYDGEFFLRLGFDALGDTGWVKSKRESEILRFRSNYSTSPKVLSHIWQAILARPDYDPSAKPLHLLILYRWLKSYMSADELKSAFGGEIAVSTIRKWRNDLLEKISSMRAEKIDAHWNDNGDLLLHRTVDGIHYSIEEPRPFNKTFKSHKNGGAAVMYEIVVETDVDRIVWLNGPFPAGKGDKKVFEQQGGLKQAIEKLQQDHNIPNFRVIADDGYVKEENYGTLSFRNELDPREMAWFKDRALSRHESLNRLTKHFGCLTSKFRNDRSSGNPNHQFPMPLECSVKPSATATYQVSCRQFWRQTDALSATNFNSRNMALQVTPTFAKIVQTDRPILCKSCPSDGE